MDIWNLTNCGVGGWGAGELVSLCSAENALQNWLAEIIPGTNSPLLLLIPEHWIVHTVTPQS
jgi:hypothetical protein